MSGKRLKDALAILSIILIGTGIGLIVIKRARSWEFGIILLILGAIIFYIRYFSTIMKDEPKIKIIDADYKIK
ncbi:Uncharacterised protein [uncultured archaeon]|nr:Uncharacterised protein [uncultured archaeon]